jgi:chorismate mutase/prephenate dehydratase
MAAKERGAAAVGSTLAAEINNLKIQFANIEDNPTNITRFFIISLNAAKPTGDDKTALMFTTAHKAGALAEVLEVFRDANLNLSNIANRPSKRANWEYVFFIECPGHHAEPHVAKAIEAARKHCLQLTVLGSFPRAGEVV